MYIPTDETELQEENTVLFIFNFQLFSKNERIYSRPNYCCH